MVYTLMLCSQLLFAQAEKSKPGMMASSKSQIKEILNHFEDKEGAILKKIERTSKNNYEIDILTKNKKCHRQKAKFTQASKKPLFDQGLYSCD